MIFGVINAALLFCALPFTQSQKSIKTASCQDTAVNAVHRFKFFNSPNYPNRFAEQTQCNWIIRSANGYRVELKFDTFYLLGAIAGKAGTNICVNQHLRIQDVLSGMTDGPYCGNTHPPTAISTGRVLRVTLESNARGLGQPFYKGFKAFYRLSREASSLRLRDPDGKWLSYTVIGGDQVVTTTSTTTIATLPTRDPEEVDDNNNAAIDAINNAANSQNVNSNDEVNKRNNVLNAPPIPYLPPPKPIKPRPKPPVRILRRTTTPKTRSTRLSAKTNPPQILYRPEKPRVTVIDYNKESEDPGGLSIGGKVGIAVGALVAVAMIILVIFFVIRNKKSQENLSNEKVKKKHLPKKNKHQGAKRPNVSHHKTSKTSDRKRPKSFDSCHTIKETAKCPSKRQQHNTNHRERNKYRKPEKTYQSNGKRSHHSGHKTTKLPGFEEQSGLSKSKNSKPRYHDSHRPRAKHDTHRKHRSTRRIQ